MRTLDHECAPRGGNAAVPKANARKHEAAMQLMYLFTSKRSEAAMPQGIPVRTFVLARAENPSNNALEVSLCWAEDSTYTNAPLNGTTYFNQPPVVREPRSIKASMVVANWYCFLYKARSQATVLISASIFPCPLA